MSQRKFQIPEALKERYRAAIIAFLGNNPSALGYTQDDVDEAALQGVLGWLDGILHESNIDFHRAILKWETERYPEGTLTYQLQRVAFEFGASFARQYIRSLFEVSEVKDAAVAAVMQVDADHCHFFRHPDQRLTVDKETAEKYVAAVRTADAEEKETPKAIRHLICKPDGAWPPSRQLYNACIEAAYEAGKESREP